MARTLSEIQAEIRKLEKQREALIEREVAGVIERIKVAIAHYGLTPGQLFGKNVQRKRKAVTGARRKQKASASAAAGVIRFRDDKGNSWTGRGRRPQWYLDALAAGKTPEALRVSQT